ncbi:MAG TPA: rhomboid family intramembrane serine protease [Candidatus Saccharimonadales bacterium]|nr:rhomboid family intramembrane serine protease [Candidatus Saccharimonadales bacterium]
MFFIPYGTREETRKQRFPYITALLVLINVAAFIWQVMVLINLGEPALAGLLNLYAAVPADVTDGTPFEPGLLTSMFLHGGLLHIVGNMLYLLPFGDNVEDRMGHLRYLLFYVLCGLLATLAYIIFNPNSGVPLLGASGAIAGVLGSYLVLHPRGRVKGFFFIIILLIPITLPAILFIGYWFIMQIFGSVASLGINAVGSEGGVAYLAHLGGFLAGLVLTPFFARRTRPTSAPAAHTRLEA